MNKVVLLSDKEQLPKGAFECARMLNEHNQILLTGVFLPPSDYWNILYAYSYGMGMGAGVPVPYYPSVDVAVANEAIKQFRSLCERSGIEYRVHEKQYEHIETELRTESRFADLLLFSGEAFYNNLDEGVYEEYTEETLHGAECPVIVVPEHFQQPNRIIIAYDGSASSVHAIKQFAHLMPELAKLDTTLVYVNPYPDADFPERAYMEELAARHFPNLTLLKLDIDPKKYFATWLSEEKNAMLVTGAQGRSGLSQIFRKSFIQEILNEHMLPVFVAHQ